MRAVVGGNPCGVAAVGDDAWVTDAAAKRLVRIDRRGVVVVTVHVDDTPCELTYAYGSLWIVTQSGWLDRVDPRTARIVARIGVGATAYEAVAALGAVWVSNRGDGTISRVDPRTNRVTRTLNLPIANPGGITFSAGQLWVGTDTSGRDTVLQVDPATGRTHPVKAGSRPAFVAALGGTVFAAGQDDGTVTAINAITRRAARPVRICGRAVNLDVLSSRSQVWVPCDLDSVVVVLDARTGRVLRRYPVRSGPAVVAPGPGGMWVTAFTTGRVLLLPAP